MKYGYARISTDHYPWDATRGSAESRLQNRFQKRGSIGAENEAPALQRCSGSNMATSLIVWKIDRLKPQLMRPDIYARQPPHAGVICVRSQRQSTT